jgi:hypothetical protein
MKSIRIAVAAAALIGLGLAASEARAQAVANVTAFKGKIAILEAGTKATREVAYIGTTTRVRNGSLANGDQISTIGADSEATVQFADGSIVKFNPSTQAAINEAPSTGTKKEGSRPVSRRIKVLVGKVWGDIKPNQTILTEFETPSGVAAVRGTQVEIGFVNGVLTAKVDSGSIQLRQGVTNFTLDSGQVMQFNVNAQTGQITVHVVADAGKEISGKMGDADIAVKSGSVISAEQKGNSGVIQIKLEAGSCTVTKAGQVVTPALGQVIEALQAQADDFEASTGVDIGDVTVDATGENMSVDVKGVTITADLEEQAEILNLDTSFVNEDTPLVTIAIEESSPQSP